MNELTMKNPEKFESKLELGDCLEKGKYNKAS